jgi:glutamate 5-kinase
MLTKLQAADIARRSGTKVVIASGDTPDVLSRVAAGEKVGTCFQPVTNTLESRKRFMLAGTLPRASVRIDDGALKALRSGGSLLPVGITQVQGRFDRGDIVRVKNSEGKDCAAGLVNYSSDDIQMIKGRRSSEIENLLGFAYGDEVIHHNNMTVLGS